MRRACAIAPRGQWGEAIDRVALDAEERARRRMVLTTEGGASLLIDLPNGTVLRDGDGLVLDDGGVVAVMAKPEPLIEVRAPDARALARIAWHVGNRHTEVQVIDGALRLRPDHVLEDMLRGLGARLAAVTAPFEPERGAYDSHGHHGHAHHDHAHGDHGHDHQHGHDHDHPA
jgi:urease accessory protein